MRAEARPADTHIGSGARARAPKLSPAALQDMAAQQATSPGQIGYLNAALYLGYHPSRAECCDLEYGDSAIASKTIQKIAKLPGSMSVVETLAQCRSQQTSAPLETFFSRLVDSLTNVADDHADFAPIAAGRVAQFLSRVRNTAELDMAVVFYVEEYLLRAYRGRGLPTPMDHELLKRAEKTAKARTTSSCCCRWPWPWRASRVSR